MNRLNLLVLRCNDIDRARTFYELLGLRFQQHAHGTGPLHFAYEDDRGVIELYPADAANPADQVGLGFTVEDLAASRVRLEQASHKPGEIRDREWGRTFVVRDPEGRRVEVKQG